MNGNGFSETDLNELQRQLTGWRRHRPGRARLPEEVWTAATKLARTQGVSWVARVLGLDYCRLRRRCAPADSPGESSSDALPHFVELRLEEGLHRHHGPFRAELAAASGARMTVELGHDVSAVVTLAKSFWKDLP